MATIGSVTIARAAIGRPHIASDIAAVELKTARPVRLRATRAPTNPPAPMAALSAPTPESPIPRRSIAATTRRTLSIPRTEVCSHASVSTQRTAEVAAMARTPAVRADPARGVARAVFTVGTRTDRVERTATAIIAAVAMLAPMGPDVPSRMPAAAGPISVPTPSAALDAMLDATSSPGLRATQGRRLMVRGRVSPPNPASTPTSRKTSGNGPPAARTTAVRPMLLARPRLTATSTRSGRQRADGTPASGAIRAGGTARTTPSSPAASAPPAW